MFNLIQKLHERMVELECPSIISQVKFYHETGITKVITVFKYFYNGSNCILITSFYNASQSFFAGITSK